MNRLASEQSPYLLQHKDNPVDWYPWAADAFDKARADDKPIFLSIGYSTCHWCHVMEHESFERPEVADVLNRSFVSIKVDREERPDVDRVYMAFIQATTGSGGWPMSVWLTPSLEPFYGGTYFPPTSRWGRPGFIDVLEEVARVWREERGKVLQSAATMVARLRQLGSAESSSEVPDASALSGAVQQFSAAFDRRRGGFGTAPKFPRPSELLFLLREHIRTRDNEPRDMALETLRAMALGGLRDHVGGGFHRYSVDADWRVPHFEKMLYDQAQLSLAYLEAAQLTGEGFFADVAAETLDYVQRELADPAGGFHSAEDADSVPHEESGVPGAHKREGAFYVWRDEELERVLGADADLFRLRYGVARGGNAPSDPHGDFTHRNLLFTAMSLDDIATRVDRPPDEIARALAHARTVVFDVRARRPRPHRDDKVLTAWNGLAIAAFARAGRVLRNSERHVASARRAAQFLRDRLWDPQRMVVRRRYRNGEVAIDGYAEDYAYLIYGLLELFQTTGEPDWLTWALELQQRQDMLFWDDRSGGWFSTTGVDPSVLLRLKEENDGAEPAASSVSVLNLLTIAHLTDDANATGKIERTFASFGPRLKELGRGVPMMLAALSTYHSQVSQIVIVGSLDTEDAQGLREVVRTTYLPTTVLIPLDTRMVDAMAAVLPWTAALRTRATGPMAFVCRDFACQQPTDDPQELLRQLAQGTPLGTPPG